MESLELNFQFALGFLSYSASSVQQAVRQGRLLNQQSLQALSIHYSRYQFEGTNPLHRIV